MTDFMNFLQQHWELALAFVLVLVYWIATEIITLARGGGIIAAQVIQHINRDEAIIIDLRPAAAFQRGHILHAHSLSAAELMHKLEKMAIARERPVILVDENGTQVSKEMALLRQAGFTRVYYLKNGMQAWLQARLPVHKD